MSTMREEIYDKSYLMFEEIADIICNHIERLLVDIARDHIERLGVDEENISVDDVINILDGLKSTHPEQVIIVETPNGSVDCKIGDTLIYEGMSGEIVIDSE